MTFKQMYQKAHKQNNTQCRICGQYIYEHDDAVAVESRIKVGILFHRDCICKESGCNKKLTFSELRYR